MLPSMNDQTKTDRLLVAPGTALKSLRMERGLTLAEVSERTEIPVSTLSKVENGKTDLTMDRLLRISVALNVNIADLFRSPSHEREQRERSRRSITRIGDSVGVKSSYGEYYYHAQDLLDKRVIPIIAEIRAKTLQEFGEYHSHVGEEFLLVLDGELTFHTDTYAPVQLKKGESIYFDSDMGHAYVASGEKPCRVLLICAPSKAMRLIEETSARPDIDFGSSSKALKRKL
jgi:transcriptional regulator with XRE-family HTH domain